MWKEFKEFAIKGNVIDLAVGVVIGGAFQKIISSLVNDMIMPLLGIILGRVNFTTLKYVIHPASSTSKELAINYGLFIQSVIDFLLISFSIFLVVKAINRFRRKKEVEEKIEETPDEEIVLLSEIRDLLKNKW